MKNKLAVPEKVESEPEYDEPLTTEEAAESEAVWQEYVAGRDEGEPLQKVREDLVENGRD